MDAPRLARLIDRAGLDALLVSAAAIAPGLAIRILDRAGAEIASVLPQDGATAATGLSRPISVDGETLGNVVVGAGGDDPQAQAIADFVVAAIELAAREGLGRRHVAAAAIDDLRELALLSRLGEALGGEIDPAGIASCVLATVARPMAAAVGFVLGPDDATVLASIGDAGAIGALQAAAIGLVGRLHAEDPAGGSCAELEILSDERFGSILAGFLRTARGHHGTIVLARPPGGSSFLAADRQLLASVAGQAAVAIERADLQKGIAERRAMDEELAIGRRIQIRRVESAASETEGGTSNCRSKLGCHSSQLVLQSCARLVIMIRHGK